MAYAPASANSKPNRPPLTFPLFPLLPPELRIRIWSLAAPHKRVLEIRSWGAGHYGPIKFTTHPHYLPVIFRVCKESRMEALRLYKRIEIGVSAAVRVPGRRYVPWNEHPANPNAARSRWRGWTAPLPSAAPHEPTSVYVSWENDIVYLGPEFKAQHLRLFLATKGEGKELEGLRYLAFDRKLWIGDADGRWDGLWNSLWSLREREHLREVIVVPDDEERCLADRWYYGKHEITMEEPEPEGHDGPLGGQKLATFVDTLDEWFERLWKGEISGEEDQEEEVDGKGDERDKEMGTERPRRPKVRVMSVRRNGQKMREYTDGISDIQKAMGDMRLWKTWTPPVRS
ncbi:hypothetical protein M430DRAFT_36661 [Amorphotheca resinae ATCC 22711]|uniref:2EXR domain-containing protein n=1 Tax=Amorphotheca resinae ATCC 22711 TaxID=857342 RepID=A0A2T3AV68_AMORE|nr:hypothetical protein M430DRAFT_36661 [Amorphotheca resinae ATCC 22711]PSS12570.1 hypothetical protein M430DRAFT_36661 [Amorphotheca resinae ATCC 22711]